MVDARIRPVMSRFPYMSELVKLGICLLQMLAQFTSTRDNTKYGNDLRIFVLLGNIMKTHDCRKKQVEIERQRIRSRKQRSRKNKKQKTGKQKRGKQEKQRSRKTGKNKITEKQEKQTSREAEKHRNRKNNRANKQKNREAGTAEIQESKVNT